MQYNTNNNDNNNTVIVLNKIILTVLYSKEHHFLFKWQGMSTDLTFVFIYLITSVYHVYNLITQFFKQIASEQSTR